MIDRLETILAKYNSLEMELTKPEVLSDIKKTKEYSKEMANLEEVVIEYKKYKKILDDIKDTKEMLKDPELGEIAKEELKSLEEEKEELDKKLEILLIPKDPNDGKNVIMEIRGAAGGDEANIFAGDLFRMYTRYAENKIIIEEDADLRNSWIVLTETVYNINMLLLGILGIEVPEKM